MGTNVLPNHLSPYSVRGKIYQVHDTSPTVSSAVRGHLTHEEHARTSLNASLAGGDVLALLVSLLLSAPLLTQRLLQF